MSKKIVFAKNSNNFAHVGRPRYILGSGIRDSGLGFRDSAFDFLLIVTQVTYVHIYIYIYMDLHI